jgi:hypothetical protein
VAPAKKGMGAGTLLLIIGASLFGLCCVGCAITGVVGSLTSASSNSSLPDQSRNNSHPYDPRTASDATSTPATPTTPPTPTQPAPPVNAAPSDDEVRKAVLAYKACPGKQGDTLQGILAAVFTIAHDDVKGSRLIERAGNHARIGVAYVEGGQEKETVFNYDLTTHEVTGSDSLARSALETLKVECG